MEGIRSIEERISSQLKVSSSKIVLQLLFTPLEKSKKPLNLLFVVFSSSVILADPSHVSLLLAGLTVRRYLQALLGEILKPLPESLNPPSALGINNNHCAPPIWGHTTPLGQKSLVVIVLPYKTVPSINLPFICIS